MELPSPQEQPVAISFADLLAEDISWGEPTSIEGLPRIHAAANAGDSVWLLVGDRGENIAALNIDPETLEITTYETDALSGSVDAVITEDTMWVINENTAEYGLFDLDTGDFAGPFLPTEIGDAADVQTLTPRLTVPSDGSAWIQRRHMLWQIDTNNPGQILEAHDLRDIIPESTQRSDFPFFSTMAADDRFLIETDHKLYLVTLGSWSVVSMNDAPSASNVNAISHRVLPRLSSDSVVYLGPDRTVVELDLNTQNSTQYPVAISTEMRNRVANTMTGIATADDRIVAVAGNHTEIEVIDTRTGNSSVIPTSRGANSWTQVLIVGISVWSWADEGNQISIWTPEVE